MFDLAAAAAHAVFQLAIGGVEGTAHRTVDVCVEVVRADLDLVIGHAHADAHAGCALNTRSSTRARAALATTKPWVSSLFAMVGHVCMVLRFARGRLRRVNAARA
jgi:hypothetical protein